MKVLIISDTFPPMISGVADYTSFLAQELVKLGLQVTVATGKYDTRGNNRIVDGVEVLPISSHWGMSDASHIFRIISRLGRGTIVHFQYGSGAYNKHPMINLLPLLIRMSKQDCPVVVTLHEFPREWERLLYRIRTLPMLLAAQGLIFVDPADERTLRRWAKLSMARIKYIPIASNIPPVTVTGAQRSDWRQKLGLMGDAPVVAFFGGIHPFKGFLDLLEAITNLRRDNFPVRLLVIGGFEPWVKSTTQYQNRVREALKDGIAAGWIRLVDKSPADTIAHCLHASDVAAFPFVNGASSNRGSILAALSQGVPVITTQGPDTPKGFQNQFGVVLVSRRDVRALSTGIRNILMSRELRQELKEKALKASRDFSWASIAQATQELYASLTVRRAEASSKPGLRSQRATSRKNVRG